MEEGRTKKSFRNIKWAYINFVVSTFLSFLSRTVFINIFGTVYLGINGLFTEILSVMSMADLGFSIAIAYSYYKPISENDTNKIAALNGFYKRVYSIIALCIAIIGVCLTPFLKKIVNIETPIKNLEIYYLFMLAVTVSSYLFVYKSTLIEAHQMNSVVSKYNSLIKFIMTGIQISLMLITKNYIVYLCVNLITNIANNIRISIVADKMFPYIKQYEKLDKTSQKAIFKNIGSIFVYKVSSVIINSTDNILISKLIGTVYVGLYSNYLMIITNLTSLINMVFRSLIASVGNLAIQETPQRKKSIFNTMLTASFWLSTVVATCTYSLINEFIKIWLGANKTLNSLTVIAIGLNFFLTCVMQPVWIYREATGVYLKTKYVMFITAILNLGLSIGLSYICGIAGILFASSISKILTYVWYEPHLLFKNTFNSSPKGYYISQIGNLILCVFVSFVMIKLINIIPVSGWIGFIIKGISCFIFGNLCFVLVYRRSEGTKELFGKAKSLIKK